MINLESDYLAGAHPRILQRLLETNLEKTAGYGEDPYCESAREKIRSACGCPEAEIHFLIGGTQTNATVIKAMLRPYEGVLAAESGHVSVHEAGAVEATRHKVLTLPQHEGKVRSEDLTHYLETFYRDGNHLHMVKPGMLYISHPTEYGTLYTRSELEELRAICNQYELPLYVDGARLIYGLASPGTDVDLETLAELTDLFYIGGTKVGALFGEALVIPRPGLIPGLYTMIKQSGGLLAKGRLLGIQFDTLFTDELYLEIAEHTIRMAEELKSVLKEKGFVFHMETPTNQQFIVVENSDMPELEKKLGFSFWESLDENHTIVRLATSWATEEAELLELRNIL